MGDANRITAAEALTAMPPPPAANATPPPAARRARTVVVDDHTILREGLSALIALEHDFEVIGQAGSIAAAVRVCQELQPDLIITDISVPGSTGVQGIVELRNRCRGARLVVLTVHNSDEYIRAALAAGANGYVLKDSSRDELIQALRAVMAGHRHLCPRAASRVVRSYLGEPAAIKPVFTGVTGREREILTLIAAGHSNKRIAHTLQRSVKTVEKHRANLMRKLDLHNIADITRFAMQSGMLAEDPAPDR